MSAFDYKKEYKQLYQPKNKPELIQVPPMQFVAVEGKGNPNEENGAYADALALLYAISFTVKMSHLGSKKNRGLFSLCSASAGRTLVDVKWRTRCRLQQEI